MPKIPPMLPPEPMQQQRRGLQLSILESDLSTLFLTEKDTTAEALCLTTTVIFVCVFMSRHEKKL
jgi:hypothetical protein